MPTLDWIGKDKVINHYMDVPNRVLNRVYSYDLNGQHSKNNGSENKIIHGKNLETLKSLLPEYVGRIKCIYIDPLYNTGNDGWVYNDNVKVCFIQYIIGFRIKNTTILYVTLNRDMVDMTALSPDIKI